MILAGVFLVGFLNYDPPKRACKHPQVLNAPPSTPPPALRRLAQETHEVARRKQEQMERLRGAFGFAEEVR